MDENKTKWLGSIMDMMEAHFGKDVELVLHDLEADYEKTIIDIRNGEVTGRTVGDGGDNLGLEVVRGTVKNGSKYLDEKGFKNMKETYYLKQEGMLTINYAYEQDGVIMYPDLIKVKVALDDGRILGIETTGYLNNHTVRDISKIKISKDEAKKTLNKELNIMSEGLAVIPTEWESEVLCYEFKGKIENQEFLVYINAENGKEEDILIITNTPNGTLTM